MGIRLSGGGGNYGSGVKNIAGEGGGLWCMYRRETFGRSRCEVMLGEKEDAGDVAFEGSTRGYGGRSTRRKVARNRSPEERHEMP